MTKRLGQVTRRLYPWLAAGVLLQAGSCAVDINATAAELTSAILSSLITSIVFGVFNVPI